MSLQPNTISEEIQDAAAAWLARRDRGLTAAEQDAYLEWLYRNPAHGRAVLQLEQVWATLNQLEQWRPAHSAHPNPDLLAPRRHSRLYWWSTTLAAAAAIALGLFLWAPLRPVAAPAPRAAIIHPGPEKLTLPDGSVVELDQGAKVEVDFTTAARHVRLLGGQAHFAVAHNPARPFFVDTGRFSIRAVGTAFSVTRATTEVGVLVTEGRVQVIDQGAPAAAPAAGEPEAPAPLPLAPVFLNAGQSTVVNLAPEATAPVVREVTPSEVERALSWQGMRLEFVDMPLGDVIADFNRYNRQKLIVANDETAALLVAGNFRADNVEAFVRLLDDSFGVTAFRRGNELVLRKTR